MTEVEKLLSSCISEIDAADTAEQLEGVKVAFLGKKGKITETLRSLKDVPDERKRLIGAEVNAAKKEVSNRINLKLAALKAEEMEKRLLSEFADVNMPARARPHGCIHPLTKVSEEIADILSGYGFAFADGPEIESEYYNFTALNIPEHHPARTMHDTFYLDYQANEEGKKLLRTHTSPVQIRSMLTSNKPPFRYFSIGAVYRSDDDATHTPMFHQIEGLMVGSDMSFAHLKYFMSDFLKKFFNAPRITLRLRPSFFPFTEPSAEVDINYEVINGQIIFGSGNKWMEVAGGGVVHPNVLKAGNIDSTKYQGIAFGFGLERLASLKYGIPDLREYFESDFRWRNVFGFSHASR